MARPVGRLSVTRAAAILAALGATAIWSAPPLSAQEAAPLQGFVVDEFTGEVIVSAHVSIVGTEMDTRTDAAGTFAFADPPPGEISIRVQADGYPTLVDNVEVRPDEIVFMHFLLPQVQIMLGELLVVGRAIRDDNLRYAEAQTAADLLSRQVPGSVSVQGIVGKNDGVILLRGVNSISLSSEPVVLLDGIRLSGGLGDAMDALSRIPAKHVRQLRVLRGPDATFIQGAANGVIMVETRSRYDRHR